METITGLIHLPVSRGELHWLESTLRSTGLLVPGNYPDPDGPVLSNYLSHTALGGIEFKGYFDRNLISPIAQIAAGKPVDPQQDRVTRLACAALAFCIWANVMVEPSVALYEFASSAGHEAALDELRLFRLADNTDPRLLLDIALGHADSLPKDHLKDVAADSGVNVMKVRETNFSKRLNAWRPNYLYVLKTLDLLRSGLRPVDAACALIDWQARESFYNGPAFLYCITAMSHRPPKGGMLKGMGSQSMDLLRRGAMNATWDICLLQQFGDRVTSSTERCLWSLWSDDVALRSLARVLCMAGEESEESWIQSLFAAAWGKDGGRLARRYLKGTKSEELNSPERRLKVQAAFNNAPEAVAVLEGRLGL